MGRKPTKPTTSAIPVERRGGKRKGAGRKPHAEHGLEVRSRKVLVSFTERQYAALAAAADDEGTTLAELVASRATLWLAGELGGEVEASSDDGAM